MAVWKGVWARYYNHTFYNRQRKGGRGKREKGRINKALEKREPTGAVREIREFLGGSKTGRYSLPLRSSRGKRVR